MTKTIGYSRTSTLDQKAGLDAQIRDLKAFGCSRIYKEQVSSVRVREQLDLALASLKPGDVFVVTKPDRLARNTVQLLEIYENLQSRGVSLVVLSMGGQCLDTRNPTAKLNLTILAGVATWEREIMLDRQREGIAVARAQGKYTTGRPASARMKSDSVKAYLEKDFSPQRAAAAIGISTRSVYRIIEEQKLAENRQSTLPASNDAAAVALAS